MHKPFDIGATYTNTGKTPGRDVVTAIVGYILPVKDAKPQCFTDTAAPGTVSTGLVLPNQEIHQGREMTTILGKEDQLDITAGRKRIFVLGKITY